MKTLLIVLLTLVTVNANAANTTLTWYGHAAFKIVTPKGKSIVIDPWLTNPLNPNAKNAVESVGAVDYILITHGHGDHVGEAVELAKKTKARLVTNFELGQNMVRLLGFPKDQLGYDGLGNTGAALPIADGEVVVNFVQAVHSSGLESKENEPIAYGGNPVGFVLQIKNGPTIYHTGDTSYFSDMSLVSRFHPDVSLINIGGHFGMEPAQAAQVAVMTKTKFAIPMHFKTFPILTQSADGFFKALDSHQIHHREMKPGETVDVTTLK